MHSGRIGASLLPTMTTRAWPLVMTSIPFCRLSEEGGAGACDAAGHADAAEHVGIDEIRWACC